MKRSEINGIMKDALDFMNTFSWSLPGWAFWQREEWIKNLERSGSIFDHNLGWDITDFGSGDFYRRGLFLFTLRNGSPGERGKPYAEKIMMVRENQETPLHFHWNKMEDIINRGGGTLLFNLYKSDEKEALSEEPLEIMIDDLRYRIRAGEQIALKPGQSLCLEPRVYHRFYGDPGTGAVLVGEVSRVNDDTSDNRFYESVGRFPEIEEDCGILHYLVGDYPALRGGAVRKAGWNSRI